MNRKAFLATIGAAIAAPFVVKAEPEKNELPKTLITPSDVEEFVRKEIRIQTRLLVKGSDLYAVMRKAN